MRVIHITFLFLVFSNTPGIAQSFKLHFYDGDRKSFKISNELIEINGDLLSPVFTIERQKISLRYNSTLAAASINLGGVLGKVITTIYFGEGFELQREIFIAEFNSIAAIREKIVNTGSKSVQLRSLIPLALPRLRGITLPDRGNFNNINLLIQKRYKNNFPEHITLLNGNKFSSNKNVSFLNSRQPNNIAPLNDLPVQNDNQNIELIKADPFFAMNLSERVDGNTLLIGYLNQSEHLADFDLSFKEENNKILFNGLKSTCDFNDIAISPHTQRTTQWIYMSVGSTIEATIGNYTKNVAEISGVSTPQKNAPSVFCSWYYHGWDYTEQLLRKDIETFSKRRLPFDVFLIDECWDVNNWGDMLPNSKWPGGMKQAADLIKSIGYKPGIWTCPYLVDSNTSIVKKHPEWLLKTSKGSYYMFEMNNKNHFVFDVTYPGVLEYLENTFHKMSNYWGFQYFKFDFMRAVILDEDYVFHNPAINRLEAYRMGLSAIRRGVGEEAYISVCGGHYGGSIGIANSQRSGSDVFSTWNSAELPKYRQNILRTWMNAFWHADPDAMMVRRSDKIEHQGIYGELSLGNFTQNEAQVNALNQYIGGGLISFTEDFAAIDEDRRSLYKHIIPSINTSSVPIDWSDSLIPSYILTSVTPLCEQLDRWNTLAIINWRNTKQLVEFKLDEKVLMGLAGDHFMLFEFFSQKIMGIYKRNDLVNLQNLDPHSPFLLKVTPWMKNKPILLGTDLHFSMGGVEISQWGITSRGIKGVLNTIWDYPVKITAAFPSEGNLYAVKSITVQPGQKLFWIE